MTARDRITTAIIAAGAIAGVIYLVSPSDGRKSVEGLLHKARAAIEAENTDRLASLISLSYRDESGLSYASLRGSFEYVFSQFSGIAVDYSITGFRSGKDTAVADLAVWGRGEWLGQTQDIAGSENDPVPLSVFLKKEFFRWKVIGSRWPRGMTGLRQFN